MITINVGHIALIALAVLGALWLLPRIVRGLVALAAAIVFMIRGDG